VYIILSADKRHGPRLRGNRKSFLSTNGMFGKSFFVRALLHHGRSIKYRNIRPSACHVLWAWLPAAGTPPPSHELGCPSAIPPLPGGRLAAQRRVENVLNLDDDGIGAGPSRYGCRRILGQGAGGGVEEHLEQHVARLFVIWPELGLDVDDEY
jgi:hypothetical protein